MTDGDPSSPDARPTGFADGKDPGALRTIGEVAGALGIRQHVLRYWEEQFPMLRPLKRSGGRRYYRPEDVRLVEIIDRLVHREGYTLRGARQALSGQRAEPAEIPAQPPEPGPQPAAGAAFAFRARLISLRTTLAGALHDS
ncbi:MerR family transcriptional regulator [Novosphingobium sp.]|jgi:DNA-binding transcriptional MerR regulator|uniref:MerR family transcriptional regulator n=1 Tax=Novosphingobium sp. TaxID=1874826 RepID=UPI001ED0BB14|nr:MerR family transcriptional regulator [Novosphingobium sp.]MBK6801449.1 MerR family transcriptional regulator [Novosphingobium sp.]MBK9010041.1 MerR family transcriptional regulator [Novosphingobium sp.]